MGGERWWVDAAMRLHIHCLYPHSICSPKWAFRQSLGQSPPRHSRCGAPQEPPAPQQAPGWGSRHLNCSVWAPDPLWGCGSSLLSLGLSFLAGEMPGPFEPGQPSAQIFLQTSRAALSIQFSTFDTLNSETLTFQGPMLEVIL